MAVCPTVPLHFPCLSWLNPLLDVCRGWQINAIKAWRCTSNHAAAITPKLKGVSQHVCSPAPNIQQALISREPQASPSVHTCHLQEPGSAWRLWWYHPRWTVCHGIWDHDYVHLPSPQIAVSCLFPDWWVPPPGMLSYHACRNTMIPIGGHVVWQPSAVFFCIRDGELFKKGCFRYPYTICFWLAVFLELIYGVTSIIVLWVFCSGLTPGILVQPNQMPHCRLSKVLVGHLCSPGSSACALSLALL